MDSYLGTDSEEEIVLQVSPNGKFLRYNEVIGRGAFKVVYKGFDQEEGVEIAWNQISMDDRLDSPKYREQLMLEATLAKSLKHDNIIKCYSSWVDKESRTINMITELFSSGTLRQFRKKHKFVDLKAIKNWGRQILKGLQYLHGHDEPIIHRDLKCDNIFVNGNHGEVKIGDLGLATIMHQGTARSVLGTPEFMAPELYDENYDERVDIYSFGMCMLELITCEYPYSECRNQAQIYKKVTSGVKPLALTNLKNTRAREFIEKCLVPASERPSAAELLKDPFLFDMPEKTMTREKPETARMSSELLEQASGSGVAEAVVDDNKVSSESTREEEMNEMWRCGEEIKLRLRGRRTEEREIFFSLLIVRSKEAWNYRFKFDVERDDSLKIAVELVKLKDLSFRDVPVAVELMDSMLLELVPGWKPCYGY